MASALKKFGEAALKPRLVNGLGKQQISRRQHSSRAGKNLSRITFWRQRAVNMII